MQACATDVYIKDATVAVLTERNSRANTYLENSIVNDKAAVWDKSNIPRIKSCLFPQVNLKLKFFVSVSHLHLQTSKVCQRGLDREIDETFVAGLNFLKPSETVKNSKTNILFCIRNH